MGTKNFIPQIWTDLIFREYNKALVFASLVNRDYEGEIQGYGDKVKINEIGPVAVKDYNGAVVYDEPTDASKFLLIDQKRYAAIDYDDIDAAQSKPKTMMEITRRMGVGLSEDIDEFIAGLSTEAGIVGGTEGSPTAINSANVTSVLSLIAQKMDENNVPQSGRVAVVPPWFAQKLTLAKITKDTNNSAVLTTGYVGTYYGFDFYMSNSVEHSGTTWYKPMFFLRNNSISFAQQIMSTEAMRLETKFADGLRSLMVYGGKVTRPSSLAVEICAPAAEA